MRHETNTDTSLTQPQNCPTNGVHLTFTPINVRDLRLTAQTTSRLDMPEGHTCILAVLAGNLTVNDRLAVKEAELALLSREGSQVEITASSDATLLVRTGEPLNEPVIGHGPFVMNTREEIITAINDFNQGRFAM